MFHECEYADILMEYKMFMFSGYTIK